MTWSRRWDYWRRRYDLTDLIVWLFGFTILGIAIYGAVRSILTTPYDAKQWLSFFVFGLSQGGVYALIALGYTLVYGILFMINFAHGDVFMFGAFGSLFVAQALERAGFLDTHPILSLIILFIVAMVVCSVIAAIMERVAYRPLRNAPRLVPLITAIGASFTLE